MTNTYVWLAEEVGAQRYLVLPKAGTPAHLTANPWEATWFPTREEAINHCTGGFIRGFIGNLIPVEHGFDTRQPQEGRKA